MSSYARKKRMPAKTVKQQKAMCAKLSYRKKHPGKKRRFKTMTLTQLRHFCKSVEK